MDKMFQQDEQSLERIKSLMHYNQVLCNEDSENLLHITGDISDSNEIYTQLVHFVISPPSRLVKKQIFREFIHHSRPPTPI